MRSLLLAAVLLLAASAATAQPVHTEAYVARASLGDIPTTPAAESDGVLNVHQSLRFEHTTGTDTTVTLRIPPGQDATAFSCTCGSAPAPTSGDVTFRALAAEPSGTYLANLTTFLPVGPGYGFTLPIHESGRSDGVVVLYVLEGRTVQSNLGFGAGLPSTSANPGLRIHQATGTAADPLPETAWFAVHPAAAQVPETGDGDEGFPWLPASLGFILGMLVWAILVSKGAVQKRSRKQEVQVAAHVEAAAKEPVGVLEAKKRALMAGLKELELAKMNNEVETAAYDGAKADLKKQAVTVMRAIETAAQDETK